MWTEADWPTPPGVRAVQTLRAGGVSLPPYDSLNLGDHCGDTTSAVTENRRRLREQLCLPSEPAWLQQVHGTGVAKLPTAGPQTQADASWTSDAGVVCAVLTADCLPVLLASRDGAVVAAVHAGWRGLAAGVLEAALAALPADPARLQAWLGAAIGPQAFEVGDEVRAAFVDSAPECAAAFRSSRPHHWYADLYALARLRLQRYGVNQIYGGGGCTYTEPQRYYSYRRDQRCGRMAALIWRERVVS